MSIVTAHAGKLRRYRPDHLDRRTTSVRRVLAGLLAAVLIVSVLSACAEGGDGRDGDSHGEGTPSAPATPATPAGEVELFEFQIAGGRASPPLERATVDQGATVRMVVASDQPDEVHLHRVRPVRRCRTG